MSTTHKKTFNPPIHSSNCSQFDGLFKPELICDFDYSLTHASHHTHTHRADMVVRSIGNSLMVILPDLVGKKITNWFDLVRPLIAFKFQTVGTHAAG